MELLKDLALMRLWNGSEVEELGKETPDAAGQSRSHAATDITASSRPKLVLLLSSLGSHRRVEAETQN